MAVSGEHRDDERHVVIVGIRRQVDAQPPSTPERADSHRLPHDFPD